VENVARIEVLRDACRIPSEILKGKEPLGELDVGGIIILK